ncbi:hypothetical protein NDU88_002412 [Pleurodeles waltl]|uniref:Uncharacterized protein n=1 Tax=Pleurodeles waltl TaxID=8319 RepID=A0AAV7MRC6_PLEWA|nr:hypothetical protein NDU88_002412 [Pleurodeles waltl]
MFIDERADVTSLQNDPPGVMRQGPGGDFQNPEVTSADDDLDIRIKLSEVQDPARPPSTRSRPWTKKKMSGDADTGDDS